MIAWLLYINWIFIYWDQIDFPSEKFVVFAHRAFIARAKRPARIRRWVKNVDRHVASPWRRGGGRRPLYTTALICLSFPRGAATRGNKGRGTEARNKKQSVRQPFAPRAAARGGCCRRPMRATGERVPPLLLLFARGWVEEDGRGRTRSGEWNAGNYLFGREHFVVIFISFPWKTPVNVRANARPDLRSAPRAEMPILERDRRTRVSANVTANDPLGEVRFRRVN